MGVPDHPLVVALKELKLAFDRSTACLEEADSGFAPREGMFTVAQHVAHVAHTIEWFVSGAFAAKGFDLDFAGHDARVREVTSLADARRRLDRVVDEACAEIGSKGPEELAAPIAQGPILGGAPRSSIVAGITDHTAHHRGALTVYARLLGKVPALPYGS